MAVNQLAEAGFKRVFNITDGMEGDLVDDAERVYRGQRLKNGWKNSGLPWTYAPTPDRMMLPKNPLGRPNFSTGYPSRVPSVSSPPPSGSLLQLLLAHSSSSSSLAACSRNCGAAHSCTSKSFLM